MSLDYLLTQSITILVYIIIWLEIILFTLVLKEKSILEKKRLIQWLLENTLVLIVVTTGLYIFLEHYNPILTIFFEVLGKNPLHMVEILYVAWSGILYRYLDALYLDCRRRCGEDES